MKALILIVGVSLLVISCNSTDRSTNIIERDFTINVTTEIGQNFGEGALRVSKLNELLTLDSFSFTRSNVVPDAMRVLFVNIADEYEGKMFRYPLTVGKTWEDKWNATAKTTLEGYEKVEIVLGTFPACLKHKTVLAGAHIGSELEKSLVNGTRYLWFAKGIGIVKMRYEHSNGIVTEAELIAHYVPEKSDEYLPTNLGTAWTYKWQNDYYNEVFIEKAHIDANSNTREHFKGDLRLAIKVTTENGEALGTRDFYMKKTGAFLGLKQASSRPSIRSSRTVPASPSLFLKNVSSFHRTVLFHFPLTIGQTWKYQGRSASQARVTIEPYEQVEISVGTFPKCLKHKTVFTEATANTEAESAVVNGTRYLWFAKGVGLIKMRYEHSNGVVTEAELTEYEVPGKSKEYLPLNLGTTWTYRWQNDYYKPMIEKVRVVEAESAHETPLRDARYVVTVSADQPAEAQVVCKLTPQERRGKKIRLRTNSYGYYISGHPVHIKDTTGRIPTRRSGNWKYEFRKAYKSPLTLTYNVSIKRDEETRAFLEARDGREFARDPATHPYLRENCTFWTGHHLFIIGGTNRNIEVAFNLPKGWHVSTPWKHIGSTGHRFTVKDQRELTDSAILIGEYAEAVAKLGKTQVSLAIGGSLKASKAEMQSTIEKFLRAYSEVFNGGPADPVLFVINPYEKKGQERLKGRSIGRSISILMDSTLDETSKHGWGPFLGHEVFHIWNGNTALEPFSLREHWFLEGITDYYAEITSVDLGYLSEREFFDRLERACESYLSTPSDDTIGGSFKASRLGYDGGSIAAAVLDLRIRHLTKNRRSLDHVMKQMYRKFGETTEKYTHHDIIQALNKVAGKDFEPFFQAYISGKERLPIPEYFNYAGLDVQIEYGEELPTTRYVIGVLQTSLKKKTWRLISVNGIEVDAFADLRERAKTWQSGDVLELTIEENGETLTLPVTLSGVSDNPPTASDASVSIRKKAETTKLQRAILAGILGKK